MYRLIDIKEPDDFKYYENVESIFESDDFIDTSLLYDLFSEIDWPTLDNLFIKYFEELFRVLPEKEDDLCMTVQSITEKFKGIFNSNKNADSLKDLSEEVHKFKKWFVYDNLVYDNDSGENIDVRDAVYNTYAVRFGGNLCNYNFDKAISYIDGYDINLTDLI